MYGGLALDGAVDPLQDRQDGYKSVSSSMIHDLEPFIVTGV